MPSALKVHLPWPGLVKFCNQARRNTQLCLSPSDMTSEPTQGRFVLQNNPEQITSTCNQIRRDRPCGLKGMRVKKKKFVRWLSHAKGMTCR